MRAATGGGTLSLVDAADARADFRQRLLASLNSSGTGAASDFVLSGLVGAPQIPGSD